MFVLHVIQNGTENVSATFSTAGSARARSIRLAYSASFRAESSWVPRIWVLT